MSKQDRQIADKEKIKAAEEAASESQEHDEEGEDEEDGEYDLMEYGDEMND